jgi:hypothetical protein
LSIITKPDQFVDLLAKAKFDKDPTAEKFVKAAIQSFINEPNRLYRKKVQAAGVSTDFAVLTKDAFNVTIEQDNFDMGWEQAFRLVPIARGQDSWEIYNVSNGITFDKIPEGGRIETRKMTGTKQTAYVDYYGGAFGWTDQMIRFRKIPAMIDLALQFRNKFFVDKADNFYLLLDTASASNTTVAWQGAAANGRLQRDILTINQTAFNIANANKDKGYGDTASARMIIYANPNDRERIEAAFRATTQSMATAGQDGEMIGWPIQRVYTFNSNISSGSPLMVLPGQKIQRAEVMAPTTYRGVKDPLTLTEIQAVWSIYGGAVGDTDQVYKFTLS